MDKFNNELELVNSDSCDTSTGPIQSSQSKPLKNVISFEEYEKRCANQKKAVEALTKDNDNDQSKLKEKSYYEQLRELVKNDELRKKMKRQTDPKPKPYSRSVEQVTREYLQSSANMDGRQKYRQMQLQYQELTAE